MKKTNQKIHHQQKQQNQINQPKTKTTKNAYITLQSYFDVKESNVGASDVTLPLDSSKISQGEMISPFFANKSLQSSTCK